VHRGGDQGEDLAEDIHASMLGRWSAL
jgi:hypothetical protein